MTRAQQWLLLGWFLAAVGIVPLSQAGLELSRGSRPQFLDIFAHTPTAPNLRAFEHQLEESSLWAGAVRPYVQYAWFKLLGDAGEKVVMGREGWLFYKPDVRYLVEPLAPTPAGDDDPASAIVSFRDQLAARGIRLLVMPAPGKPAVYPDRLTRRVEDGGSVHSHTQELMGRLRQSGVEVVDLFDLFQRLRGAPAGAPPWYLLRDTHWSGRAARVAAEAVARRIRKLGWIAPGGTSYTLRERRVLRRSDIARMIRVPDIEREYPAEEVVCEQVRDAASGEPYRDDPRSPVLILGDSFLRIYQTDEPRAAGFIAHLARELGMPLASVVNDGGASTLVRQELARRPDLLRGKRLVIWEFVERDVRFGTEGWKPVPLPPA